MTVGALIFPVGYPLMRITVTTVGSLSPRTSATGGVTWDPCVIHTDASRRFTW